MDYISLLESTYNTRDMGGIPTENDKMTRRDVFWRSDVPLHPTQSDFELMKKHGITTVVDLRREDEIVSEPSGFKGREGISYYSVPISDGANIPKSVSEVSGSYMRIADSSRSMRKVFALLAQADGGVLFNCHAGKDRTGVVAAILLLLAGVKKDDIIQNYTESKFYLKGMFRSFKLRHPDVDMRIVTPSEAYMSDFLTMFEKKYITAEKYLRRMGVTGENIRKLRNKLSDSSETEAPPLYSGVLIKESLADEEILGSVRIERIELWRSDKKPRYWTAVYFSSYEADFPDKLAAAITEDGTWYCDFKDGKTKIIVLNGAVLRYEIGNAKQKAAVRAECRRRGIPEEQMDWSE